MKTLEQLQAENLPHCDVTTLKLDRPYAGDYFERFVPLSTTCIRCGFDLAVTWAIAHGECFCIRKGCGYPSRALHYIEDKIIYGEVLQYHPSVLTKGEQDGD